MEATKFGSYIGVILGYWKENDSYYLGFRVRRQRKLTLRCYSWFRLKRGVGNLVIFPKHTWDFKYTYEVLRTLPALALGFQSLGSSLGLPSYLRVSSLEAGVCTLGCTM